MVSAARGAVRGGGPRDRVLMRDAHRADLGASQAVSQLVRVLTTVGRGEVAQHVIKATFSDDDKPKEKHVKALVDVLQSMPPSHPEYDFVPQLIERAHSGDWKVRAARGPHFFVFPSSFFLR
jgi:hypothetical protein